MRVLFVFLSLLSLTLVSASIMGTSVRFSNPMFHHIAKLNCNHVRLYAHFRYVAPTLQHVNLSLTPSAVQADWPLYMAQLQQQLDFTNMDEYVQGAVATGAKIIMELGEGTKQALPFYNVSSSMGVSHRSHVAVSSSRLFNDKVDAAGWRAIIRGFFPTYRPSLDDEESTVGPLLLFDPSTVGAPCYTAYMMLYTRIMVQRYATVVSAYQVENELNESFLSCFIGQRLFSFITPWASFDFTTTLLNTLIDTVKLDAPNAQITTNLHTDVPLEIHHYLHLPGDYMYVLEAEQWQNMLTFLSFDSYPNMFYASPLQTSHLVDIMVMMRQLVPTLPIVVMETGYPSLAPQNPTPSNDTAQFTETQQAMYAQQSIDNFIQAGGAGVLWFNVDNSLGISKNFTDDDFQVLAEIRLVLEHPTLLNELGALKWLLFHLSALGGLVEFAHEIGAAWGTQHQDGTDRLVVQTLTQLFSKYGDKQSK